MLGLKLDIWDFLTFVVILALVGAFLAIAMFVLGLVGRIALARKHPDVDGVNMMGWLGFLAVVPWMQAFIWAFKPTTVIDIRYLSKQEQQNIAEEIARLKGETEPEKDPKSGAEESRPLAPPLGRETPYS